MMFCFSAPGFTDPGLLLFADLKVFEDSVQGSGFELFGMAGNFC